MFESVLVANRGEIAVRIIRTLREMGLRSIATYSDADAQALFVDEADEAYRLGPSPAADSYLNIESILNICHQSGAAAVHPGYGFLSENAMFADAVVAAGLVFIGPTSKAIRQMGDKVEARRIVSALGVPLVPGSPEPVFEHREAARIAAELGYPVAIKAAGGGGGRGIRVVREEAELPGALETASREAQSYFHNPHVYIERYFDIPRHVEIQILGDSHGNIVHLAERECSVQRRHQKIIEESPSPAVDRALRERMGNTAVRAAESVGYTSAGTVEFLLAEDGEFYFLEMNTRLQVEHPVTEMVTGLDLVREMVLIAAGEPMSVAADVMEPYGHAIEVRLNAEDVRAGFRPTPSLISRYRVPGGPGIRVDSGIEGGYAVPEFYDSLMAKLIGWGPDRARAIATVSRALGEIRIEGPATTVSFVRQIINSEDFATGSVTTHWLEDHVEEILAALPSPVLAASATPDAISRSAPRQFEVEVNRKRFAVSVSEVGGADQPKRGRRERRLTAGTRVANADVILSPMHGTVVAVRMAVGDPVQQGQTVVVIEAMKMENEVPAPRSGTVSSVGVAPGDTVEMEQELGRIT